MGSRHSTAKEIVDKFSGGNDKYLVGKVAVITGGNSGIGLETVKAFASAGCHVIMASRSVENGRTGVKTEIEQAGHGGYIVPDTKNITVEELNLESLKSIRRFADVISKESKIDFLVLNAGIMAVPQLEHTENGWERQIGTNHFGHFYLTSLLLDKMSKQSHPSRIIVVSSVAHNMGSVKVDDLHYKGGRSYSPWEAYGQSKKANILFTKGLADRLKDTQVRTVCLHPGVIKTNLQRHLNPVVAGIVNACVTDKTIPQGAATTLYGCLSPEFEKKELSGSYLSDCAIATPDAEAQDATGTLRAALWKATEDQIKAALVQQGM